MIRNDNLKKEKPTLAIIDAKSIKNTDTAKEKGYDANKKVSGIKLHIVVDTMGLPHAAFVTCADMPDRKGALKTIESQLDTFCCVKKFIVDGGYTGKKFAKEIKKLCNAEVEVIKRKQTHEFEVLPIRWIVERSFGWLEKYRRLWKNCERKLNNSLQMTILAFISILIRRF